MNSMDELSMLYMYKRSKPPSNLIVMCSEYMDMSSIEAARKWIRSLPEKVQEQLVRDAVAFCIEMDNQKQFKKLAEELAENFSRN